MAANDLAFIQFASSVFNRSNVSFFDAKLPIRTHHGPNARRAADAVFD
jgi:hypothetical protein